MKFERKAGDLWPIERSSHAACCLGFGSKYPHLLVSGGVEKTMKDAWLFDVASGRWKQVKLYYYTCTGSISYYTPITIIRSTVKLIARK